jgi:hypothetical protein
MEYAIGLVVSLAIFGSSTVIGFDRERAFYPAVMIVIAAYYVLFAAMGATAAVRVLECAAASVFGIVAVIGFKTRLWLVAAALAGHGVFDFFHHYIIENPGVPHWWPGFCLAADVVAAVFLAVLLKKRPALAL